MSDRNQAAIQFIVDEVYRFSRMDREEKYKESDLMDMFASLPHPQGDGSIRCGKPAYLKLQELSRTSIEQRGYAEVLDENEVLDSLSHLISERFLRDGREISIKSCDKLVSDSIKYVFNNLKELAYYIPVRLGDSENPDKFSLGGIDFVRCDKFLADREAEYTGSRDSDAGEVYNFRYRSSVEYYKKFNWVAIVEVGKRSESIARVTANEMVQRVLDFLHVCLGPAATGHIRVGGAGQFSIKQGLFFSQDCDAPLATTSRTWYSRKWPDHWWEVVCSCEEGVPIALFEIAMKYGFCAENDYPISKRVLDGFLWFGDAVRDNLQASRVIKYVTAMERVLITNDCRRRVSEAIGERGGALIYDRRRNDYDAYKKKVKRAYALRSDLVHGSCSPSKVLLTPVVNDVVDVAPYVVMYSLLFYGSEFFSRTNVPDSEIQQKFSNLINIASKKNGVEEK